MENCIKNFMETFAKNKKDYNDNFFEERLEKYNPSKLHLEYEEIGLKLKDYVKKFLQPPITKEKVSILKYFLDLSVDAPQYLSPSTLIFPILSNSVLYFMNDLKL